MMRSLNRRRNWYRKAAKEKARLAGLGYALEVVRLYALYLANPTRENRFKRFVEAFHKPVEKPMQLELF